MFPRGAGNLEEVPQDLVSRCIVNEAVNHGEEHAEQADGMAAPSSSLFFRALDLAAQTDVGWDFVRPEDWCRAMMTCKGARATLGGKHEWLGILGYKLIKQPDGFSPAALLGILLADPAFSGGAWRTALLTDRVEEMVDASAKKVNLLAMSSAADSTAFWTARLQSLLGLPNMPTGPQVDEARKTVRILVDTETGAGLSAMMEACLAVQKPNSTVGPIILATTIDIAPRRRPGLVANDKNGVEGCDKMMEKDETPKAQEFLCHEAMGALLAKTGVTSIRTLVMLMGGVAVDNLKKKMRALPKLRGISIPRSVRRAMVKALTTSSWFALLGVFRFEMFFKNLFRSIHIVQVLQDRAGNIKTDPDKAKVFLLQALLRSECYPATQKAYDALSKAGRPWDKLVVAPLARIDEDPLFRVDGDWLATGFQKQLAGQKVPRPHSTSVESMICAYGNRRVTWHAILDCGQITMTQLLRNVVNLAMMDFPMERVQTQLLKSCGSAPMPELMKAYTVLKTKLSPAKVNVLTEAVLAMSFEASNQITPDVPPDPIAEANAATHANWWRSQERRKGSPAGSKSTPFSHPEPPGKKRRVEKSGSGVAAQETLGASTIARAPDRRDPPPDEFRVKQYSSVADKEGQRHQISRARTISTRFGQTCVDEYVGMMSSVLSSRMQELTDSSGVGTCSGGAIANKPGMGECGVSKDSEASVVAGEVSGVISYTEELSKNVVRSGVPPPLPDYTRVAMWRGESVCLEQIGAGQLEKELLVGIAWCERKGGGERVDLDLSVMIYDAEWRHLADCSWDIPGMCIPGVQHSGDVTSAPYPNGGRETCTINVPDLLAGFPSARYIALVVYSYSKQKWEDLEDASVFVANPHARGSGPGGMAVIAAARLTGESTTSIAGFLDLAPSPSAAAAGNPDKEPETPVFGIKANPEVSKKEAAVVKGAKEKPTKRVHFVFTSQEGRYRFGGQCARGSMCQVGQMLAKMETSRAEGGAQTLADASAFQAALVCDKVCIVSEGEEGGEAQMEASGADGKVIASQSLVKGDDEGRFAFYQRIAAALEAATPATPAAGREGIKNYPMSALRPSGGGGRGGKTGGTDGSRPVHTVFFGGDLDDWLEVTREYSMYKGKTVSKMLTADDRGGAEATAGEESTLTLVNLHSSEKGHTKDEDGVARVNGATAYEELCQAIREARGAGIADIEGQG